MTSRTFENSHEGETEDRGVTRERRTYPINKLLRAERDRRLSPRRDTARDADDIAEISGCPPPFLLATKRRAERATIANFRISGRDHVAREMIHSAYGRLRARVT